jgi:hypothetical protein
MLMLLSIGELNMDDTQIDQFKEPSSLTTAALEMAKFEPDHGKYLSMIEDIQATQAQKVQLVETIISIMKTFVELGYRGDICAQIFDGIDALAGIADTTQNSLDSAKDDNDGRQP